MKKNSSASFSVLLLGAGMCASAALAADPTDATAGTSPTHYQSPFAGYRALGADQATPWREANDTVKNIGGWQAYAKEAADAAKARAATNAKPTLTPSPALPSAESPPPSKVLPPQHRHGG